MGSTIEYFNFIPKSTKLIMFIFPTFEVSDEVNDFKPALVSALLTREVL